MPQFAKFFYYYFSCYIKLLDRQQYDISVQNWLQLSTNILNFSCKNFVTGFVLNNLKFFFNSCNQQEVFVSVIKNSSLVGR